MCYKDSIAQPLDEDDVDADPNSNSSIRVTDDTGVTKTLSYSEVGLMFDFEYSSRLQFLHESDLRGAQFWAVDKDNREEDMFIGGVDSIGTDITTGKICDKVSLRHIGVIGGVDIGYGAFAESAISSGTLIGEYVGILSATSEPTQYSLSYPSCTGSHEINASCTGNMIRFVNHSSSPNCSFRVLMFETIPHVVCIASRNIDAGEQVTVSYGAAFWHYHARDNVSNLKEVPL